MPRYGIDSRTLLARDLLVGHRRLPREGGHEDGGLLQLVLAHALGKIGVGVARALVVGAEVLNDVEAGQPRLVERDVIGGADPLDDIPRRAEILQGRDPAIENHLRGLIAFHVEADRLAASRIVVQVDGELVARGGSVEVLHQVRTRAEQTLLLTAPQGDAYRPPWLSAER